MDDQEKFMKVMWMVRIGALIGFGITFWLIFS